MTARFFLISSSTVTAFLFLTASFILSVGINSSTYSSRYVLIDSTNVVLKSPAPSLMAFSYRLTTVASFWEWFWSIASTILPSFAVWSPSIASRSLLSFPACCVSCSTSAFSTLIVDRVSTASLKTVSICCRTSSVRMSPAVSFNTSVMLFIF